MKINCPRNCTSEIQGICQSTGECKCSKEYTNQFCSEKIEIKANSTSQAGQEAFDKLLNSLHKQADKIEADITKKDDLKLSNI